MTTEENTSTDYESVSTARSEGYWCAVCGRLLIAEDGVIVHDNLPHPEMNFDEEDKPQ